MASTVEKASQRISDLQRVTGEQRKCGGNAEPRMPYDLGSLSQLWEENDSWGCGVHCSGEIRSMRSSQRNPTPRRTPHLRASALRAMPRLSTDCAVDHPPCLDSAAGIECWAESTWFEMVAPPVSRPGLIRNRHSGGTQ
jgi:hypothetical protein